MKIDQGLPKACSNSVAPLWYADISFDVVRVNSINHNYFGYFNHYLEGPTRILEEGNFQSKTTSPPPLQVQSILCVVD